MEPLVLHLPADPAALATLRRDVREWLERLQIVEQDMAAIVAACSEVAAGAIEAGPADVHGMLAGGDVVVRIAGAAAWRVEDHPSRYVAALLVDDVSLEHTGDVVAVVLRKAASRGLR
jgi:anti-sigma regulatory factor (Ser/Thr protein kinase)